MKVFKKLVSVVAVLFILGGIFAIVRGINSYNLVKKNLVAQHITTSPDSAIPNVEVNSAETATAEADVIAVHASEAVKGMLGEDLTYAQIPHENPDGTPFKADDPKLAARGLLQQAAALRTSLYSAAMAFGLSEFVIAFGIFMIVLGGTGLAGVLLTDK